MDDATTDASGNVSFTATLQTAVASGQFITATATKPRQFTSPTTSAPPETSEFSQCIQLSASDPTPEIEAGPGTLINESCAPSNSALDPGER